MVGSESVPVYDKYGSNANISSISINTVPVHYERNCHPVQKALLHQTVAQMKALGLDIAAESAGALGASIARSDIPFK